MHVANWILNPGKRLSVLFLAIGLVALFVFLVVLDDGNTVCRGSGWNQECWNVDDPSGPGRR